MESVRLIYRNEVAEWEYSPPSTPCKWSDNFKILALAYLTPAEEQAIYRKLKLPKTMAIEHTHEVAQARQSIAASEAREAKERADRQRKAQQDATSKAKSQALQRSAREEEERAREEAFARALAKRDALAAEAEAAAQAKAAEEAQREAAPSQPRKRNYRQRQKHKQQQLEALEAKQLQTKLDVQLNIADVPPPPPPESDPEDEKLCSICMEGEKTHACLPCGHRCLCAACAEPSLKLETCPICRVPVLMRARIFV